MIASRRRLSHATALLVTIPCMVWIVIMMQLLRTAHAFGVHQWTSPRITTTVSVSSRPLLSSPSTKLPDRRHYPFIPTVVSLLRSSSSSNHRPRLLRRLYAVMDVGSEDNFDEVVQNAGDKLVVVDYSTTWCGPCKVIAPKFDEFSEKYSDNAVFLKVIGDASAEASKLMKREGVRSVPSFHYFVKGEKVEVVNGANAEAIEAAITKHLS